VTTTITRAELIEHIAARRVVVDQVRGDSARITITRDKSTTITTVPRDWIKPMLAVQVSGKGAPR
jgi:hypothetical protein